MSQIRTIPVSLIDLVTDFARAVQEVDSRSPVAANSRTGALYQPAIGPHTETQTVSLVMTHLSGVDPVKYSSCRLGVPYGDGTRQSCDMCLGDPAISD